MLALLPLVCCALAAVVFRLRAASRWREAMLLAAVSTGVLSVALAELAGAGRLFGRGAVTAAWAVLTLAFAGVLFKARGAAVAGGGAPQPRPDRAEATLLTGVGILGGALALVAWAVGPNNWDSMTYHLPRVLHWIQNGSLDHYPTHIIRQLTLSPGAEYAVAQVQLLAGSERLIAFVQALAWLGGTLAASLVAKDLGAGRRGQVLAAVFAATLPMAILQASSTQNDLVVAFWLLAFAHFALRAVGGAADGVNWLAAGGSLGLALLTKATAFLYAFPFVLWLAIAVWRSRRAVSWRAVLAAGALALLVNVAPWTRNLTLFGSVLGGDHGAVNAAFTPAIVASNLARNASLQLTMPSSAWNRAVEQAVLGLHAALGIGANDPRSTWKGAEFRVPARLSGEGTADAEEALFAMLHEDQAGNPLHLGLLLTSAAAVLARPDLRRRHALRGSVVAVAGGLILFCAILKWQPWNARLMLPLFLLAAPVAGAVLGLEGFGRWAAAIAALLLFCSLPWAVLNATRPLIGPESVLATPRLAQSFAARPALRAPFAEAARAIAASGCKRIGLEIGPDDPEYLIWAALAAEGAAPERLEHVRVTNRSAKLSLRPPFATFAPCAVIVLAPPGAFPAGSEIFSREWQGGRIAIRPGP